MVSQKTRDRMMYVCIFMFVVYMVFYFLWQHKATTEERGAERKIFGIPVDGLCTYGLSSPRDWKAWVGIIAAIISCCSLCMMAFFFYSDHKDVIHGAINQIRNKPMATFNTAAV